MRDFLRLTWKEARELFRPKYLLPILMTPLLFVAMGVGFGGATDAVDGQPTIGVIVEDDGEYGQVLNETLHAEANVTYAAAAGDPQTAIQTVTDRGGRALIVVPPDFTERVEAGEPGRLRIYSVVEAVSLGSIADSHEMEALLERGGRQVTMAATGASPAELDPIETAYTTDVKGTSVDSSPAAIAEVFTTHLLVIPLVIVFVIFFSGQMLISAMGIEKENKTLETLLTMPVARRTIVGAKLAGSGLIGVVVAATYTGALYFYQSSLTGGGSTIDAFSLGGLDYLLVGISLTLALVGALALALCLGVFVEDRQAAQMLLFPLGLLVFVPFIVAVVADVETVSLPVRALLFAIPFTHPIIAPKQLMFGGFDLVLAGIVYEAIFALVAIALAVRLFDSDRLVTGSRGHLGSVLRRLQR